MTPETIVFWFVAFLLVISLLWPPVMLFAISRSKPGRRFRQIVREHGNDPAFQTFMARWQQEHLW